MSNDPTTKPCPDCPGDGSTWVDQTPCACHGTGRVPMDTGELLEALFDAGEYIESIERLSDGMVIVILGISEVESMRDNLDEALSAALREVTK